MNLQLDGRFSTVASSSLLSLSYLAGFPSVKGGRGSVPNRAVVTTLKTAAKAALFGGVPTGTDVDSKYVVVVSTEYCVISGELLVAAWRCMGEALGAA